MYFQEAKIEIRSSDDSGDSDDCDDKDHGKMTNKNNNKRKRPAPSKHDTAKSNGPTHESPAKRTNRTLDDIQAKNSQKIINDKGLDQAESGGKSIATTTTPRDVQVRKSCRNLILMAKAARQRNNPPHERRPQRLAL